MSLDQAHRGGGAGAGDLHADARTSIARSRHLRRAASRSSSGDERGRGPRRYFARCARAALPGGSHDAAVLRGAASGARGRDQCLGGAGTRRGRARGGRDAVDARCRQIVASLGAAGLTRYCVRREFGGALPDFDARAICLIRETLAYHDGLADFAFAMQGLGSGAISLAGAPGLQADICRASPRGEAIAAFALSEPHAGSDVAAMTCRAVRDGEDYVLDGGKTWISNGGIADFYCVFARTQAGQRRADGSTAAQRHQRIRRRGVRRGTSHRAAHRCQCAAPAGAARVRRLPDSRRRGSSERRARGSKSRCARSTCSAPPWRRRRSASRAGRSRKRQPTQRSAACSAERSRIFS